MLYGIRQYSNIRIFQFNTHVPIKPCLRSLIRYKTVDCTHHRAWTLTKLDIQCDYDIIIVLKFFLDNGKRLLIIISINQTVPPTRSMGRGAVKRWFSLSALGILCNLVLLYFQWTVIRIPIRFIPRRQLSWKIKWFTGITHYRLGKNDDLDSYHRLSKTKYLFFFIKRNIWGYTIEQSLTFLAFIL